MASSPLKSFSFLAILFLLASNTAPLNTSAQSTASKEIKTHLRIYYQDIWLVPNATGVFVAHLNGPFVPFAFGDIGVFDNALTEGPDGSSRLLGRGRGMIVWASREDFTALTLMNLVFTDGEYNGSTIALVGPAGPGVSERTIVGGSGKFRLARGYMITTPFSTKNTTFVDVLDIYVTQY